MPPARLHHPPALYLYANFIPIPGTAGWLKPARLCRLDKSSPGVILKVETYDVNGISSKHGPQVRFYSGFRGDETPRTVILSGREYPVLKILWRKRVRFDKHDREIESFRCQLPDRQVDIRCERSGDTTVATIKDVTRT